MKRKIIKHIFIIAIVSAFPAFLAYLANSSLIFDKLIESGLIGETIDIPFVQDCCLWISIVFSALALSLNLIITKIRCEQALEQRNSLIKMNKDILASSLGKKILSDSSSFDVRIFIPKHPLLYNISEKLHIHKMKKKFVIKNIDLIADQGITNSLQFEVFPKQEGLVGLCYNEKVMVYDDNLKDTNETDYQLDRNQITRTSNLKWSVCCPIFDKKSDVIAVLALDGKTGVKIDKTKEDALRKEMFVFSRMLYDAVPTLFKR